MQRGTYRVHGCARCKKRKVKCDNTLPCCSQCKRLKKPCPGSTAGLIFQNAGTWIPTSGAVVSYDQRQQSISQLAIDIGRLNTSPWTPHHWFFTLPALQYPERFQQVILSSLQAISVAFKAVKTGDATLRQVALQNYSQGLAMQRRQLDLLKLDNVQPPSELILWPLLTSLLLMEFEIMAPLASYSWAHHAFASFQLLALLGPEACQSSPVFEIFWQLRVAMGYVAMLTGVPSCLEQSVWRDIPFLHRGKTPLDYMMDPFSPLGQSSATDETSIEPAHRMMQLLHHTLRLSSQARPILPPKDIEEASRTILSDADYLLNQDSTSSRMGLQCVFSVRLVALYTPCQVLKEQAQTMFYCWQRRFTLQ